MENTKKLTGKDLINVGIYTAMTLVIFFVVGLLTALPVVYRSCSAASALAVERPALYWNTTWCP